MKAFIAGNWRNITSAKAYYSGAWRSLSRGKSYLSGAWRDIVTFVQPLTVTTADFEGSSGSSTVSATCSAVPSGGLNPFTYSWTILSSSGGTFSLNSAATANVIVFADGVSRTAPAYCTLQCTVTDSLGHTATATASGVLTNESDGGGIKTL